MENNDDKENNVVRKLKRFINSLGIAFPDKTVNQDTVSKEIKISSYTDQEMRYIPNFNPKYTNYADKTISQGALMEQLLSISQTSGNWVRESMSFRELTPEIKAAADIMVGSIMSPTDMHTDCMQFVLSESGLGEEIEQKISDIITNFANDQLDIGPKCFKWCSDALYGSGSAAVLLLPESNIKVLNTIADLDNPALTIQEKLDSMSKYRSKETDDSEKTSSGESFLGVSCESFISDNISTERMTNIEHKIEQDVLEKFSSNEAFKTQDILTSTKEARKVILDLFREGNKNFAITNDASVLKSSENKNKKTTVKMTEKLLKRLKFDGSCVSYYMDQEFNEGDEVSLVQIDTNAVVPIPVPGDSSKHIGYFILIDQWGIPISDPTVDKYDASSPRKLTESDMQAVTGKPSAYHFAGDLNNTQRFDAMMSIFGSTLKILMEEKLNEYGFTGVKLDEHEAIATCLFKRLAIKEKIGLVFVPSSLMIYFTFDYNDDGTGKSLLHDIAVLVALRNTLTIAGVMAAAENSIDNKIIEVDVDEKNANVQQILDIVRNAFTEKHMYKFDHNPQSIQRDLVQKSMTIVPKNMKGLKESLSVTSDRKTTGAIQPDNELMEKLTNWMITALEIPHAAMNQLSENEYSKSVATSNMHFNNNIKCKQKIVTKHLNKLIKLYISYSTGLQEAIKEVLRAAINTSRDSSEDVKSGKVKIEHTSNNIEDQLKSVIQHIHVSLPTPQMMADKTQYAEIEAYISSIERIINDIFPDDMILDQNYQDIIRNMRAQLKSDMLRDFVSRIGFQSSYAIPFPKDINFNSSMDLYNFAVNNKAEFINFKKQVAEKVLGPSADGNLEGGGGGWDSGSSGGGFGGGGDSSGGGWDTGSSGGDNGGWDTGNSGGDNGEVQFDETPPPGTENNGSTPEATGGGTTSEPAGGAGGGEQQNNNEVKFDETPPPASF